MGPPAKRLASGQAADRLQVQQKMAHWRRDADLAGVREPAALAKLPEAVRQTWQTF
jgi:hypothetical protein